MNLEVLKYCATVLFLDLKTLLHYRCYSTILGRLRKTETSVGMAATLAGGCQVPLTAVLLLFELTQDYRIVLPLLGAVGFSAWTTSDKTRRRATDNTKELNAAGTTSSKNNGSSICELESSLCLNIESDDENQGGEIPVSQAMRRRYVKTELSTCVTDVASLMLEEKQSCALIVDYDNCLIGLLTLTDGLSSWFFMEEDKSKN